MSIEAMKQALEALETLDGGDSYKTHNAATALRQAIAEAEKQPVHASDISQEPVDETVKDRREWVGLTDEEIGEIYRLGWSQEMELAQAIEAKLKEKNNGNTN
jgi:hypothetical protein